MKKQFNIFMKVPEFKKVVNDTPAEYRAAKTSTIFNAWMMATMNHPTEFANKFMVRKWLAL